MGELAKNPKDGLENRSLVNSIFQVLKYEVNDNVKDESCNVNVGIGGVHKSNFLKRAKSGSWDLKQSDIQIL